MARVIIIKTRKAVQSASATKVGGNKRRDFEIPKGAMEDFEVILSQPKDSTWEPFVTETTAQREPELHQTTKPKPILRSTSAYQPTPTLKVEYESSWTLHDFGEVTKPVPVSYNIIVEDEQEDSKLDYSTGYPSMKNIQPIKIIRSLDEQ